MGELSEKNELARDRMMDLFKHYDENTGQYIETNILHVTKPDDLKMPVLDGVERTMNLNITRAAGWHYADGGMLFIPAYRKVAGQSLSFGLSYLTDSGGTNKDGIVFEFAKSRSFAPKIPILDVFTLVFNVSDPDTVRSMIGVNSPLLSDKYLKPLVRDNLVQSIKSKSIRNTADLSTKLKTMLTTQTLLDNPARLYDMLGLSHFVGHSLAETIEVGSVLLDKFSVLTEDDVFLIEHSGLTEIKLLTPQNKIVNVTLLPDFYCQLSVNEIAKDRQYDFREMEIMSNHFEFEGRFYNKRGAPIHNTLEVYCAIINRLLVFPESGINFSMQDYKNQRIVDFSEKIADFRREDLEVVYNNLANTPNFLDAIQDNKLSFIDTKRAQELIKNSDSSLAVISKNENPLAKTSNGNVLVRDVKHLSKEAIQVMPQDSGLIDPVDSAESKNIGKTTPLTMTAEFGEHDGSLYSNLYKVVDGVVTTEVEKVHVKELPSLFVAEHGADLTNNVLAKHNGEVKLFPASSITHTRVSPFSTTSVCRGSSAFMENTDQKRTQMTANAQKQARATARPQRALIETGVESIAANGDTGLKHIFTIQDIFNKYHRVPKGENYNVGKGPFKIIEVSHLGMSKEYRLISETELNKSALFKVTTEKSSYGSSYFYELVAPSDGSALYSPTDIVYKQHNIVIGGTVEGTDRLDYHTKGREDYFNMTVGNGHNLFVMFGFSNSFTVDDASVMSDRVVRDMSLATPVLVTKRCKLFKLKNGITEYRGIPNGLMPKGFSGDGLPIIGTYLLPGSTWFHRYQENSKEALPTINSMSLDHEEHGEVIDVVETSDEVKITIAKWVQVEVGDKFSARHGNKTIVAKVLPAELMPYDPVTGRHVDMIINPLGIPSRGNISQLAELQATAEVKAKGLDSKIIPPFSNELYKMVENYEQGKELTEVQFINPQTGLYYPEKHFCGYMHYLRNAKISEDQIHAIGDSNEIDIAYLQPVGGSGLDEKGQSISSMEKEILISYGADGILDEIHGILSSDREGFQKASKLFVEGSVTDGVDFAGKNIQAESMQHAALAFHSVMRQDGESIRLSYLNDKDMENFAKVDLNQIDYSLNHKSLLNTMMYIPLSGGFVSPVAIKKFGALSIIRVLKVKTKKEYTTNVLGYDKDDDLTSPVTLSEEMAEGIISRSHSFVVTAPEEEGDIPLIFVFPKSINDNILKELNLLNRPHYHGMEDLVQLLRDYPMDLWVNYARESLQNQEENSNKVYADLDAGKRLAKYESYLESGGFEQFITTRFPVLPNKYRQGEDGRHSDDSITTAYRDICLNADNLDALYARVTGMLLPSDTSKNRLSLFEFFAKKDLGGRIRGKILKTRVLCSMRSTIVPMFHGDPKKYGYPDFAGHPDSIGLPLVGAIRISQPQVVAYMHKNYPEVIEDIRSDIEKVSHVISILTLPLDEVVKITKLAQHEVAPFVSELKKGLIEHINGSYVFYGRAPSLQETSLRGGRFYVHEERVIHLHSLLTTDLNADHDGDQIYVVKPNSHEAIEDIKTKLLPSTKALRYNDGKPSLLISQDAILGLFFATSNPTSDAVKPLTSIDQVNYHIQLGLLNYTDIVTIPMGEGKILKATAGRILVNDAIYDIKYSKALVLKPSEEGENILTVPYDCIIAGNDKGGGRDVSEVQLEIANIATDLHAVGIYNRMQNIGYEAVERRNLTVGIKDLTPALKVEKINKEIKIHVENARTLEELGLLPDDYIIDLDKKLSSLVKKLNIMDLVPDDNAFKILAVSGAKGKQAGIEKMFGVQGFIADNKGGKLPTPLLSNTVRGLSQFQVEELSYTQRDNAISTVFETSKPGETLRSGAFELSGLIIQEPSSDNELPQYVPYSHKIIELTDADGNKLSTVESRDIFIGKRRSSAVEIKEGDSNYSYQGMPLTTELLEQLADAPVPSIALDQEGYFLFPDVEPQNLAKQYFSNKFEIGTGKFVNASSTERLLAAMPTHINICTHLNEFSTDYGISQHHAGARAGEKVPHEVLSNIGIKASTATAQPANQLVISKRNMDRAGGLDNGIDMFKNAIQSAKFHGNERNAIELLAPENGFLNVMQTDQGYTFALQGESGKRYLHMIKVDDELGFKFRVGSYPVFMGQTVAAPANMPVGERLVHPLLSFTWHTTKVDGMKDIKEELVNPSTDLIQLVRYYIMVYLESIYRDNGIVLDFNHYGCFALQIARHVFTVKTDPTIEAVSKVGYLNIFNYAKDVVNTKNDSVVRLELTNGSTTIMLTAGPVASMAYRDAISAISKASVIGPLREFGGISKVALGVNLKKSVGEKEVNSNANATRSVRHINLDDLVKVDERFAGDGSEENTQQEQEQTVVADFFSMMAGGGVPATDKPADQNEEPKAEVKVDAKDFFSMFAQGGLSNDESESTSTDVSKQDESNIFGGGKD